MEGLGYVFLLLMFMILTGMTLSDRLIQRNLAIYAKENRGTKRGNRVLFDYMGSEVQLTIEEFVPFIQDSEPGRDMRLVMRVGRQTFDTNSGIALNYRRLVQQVNQWLNKIENTSTECDGRH